RWNSSHESRRHRIRRRPRAADVGLDGRTFARALTMRRAAALKLLRAHAARPLDPHEAAMTADTIRFVEAHDDCLHRSCVPGHLTGSTWIVSPDRQRVLLTHHL